MIRFIIDNIGTIIVSVIVIAVLCFIAVIMIKDKRKGTSCAGCGGGCGGCPNSGLCHGEDNTDKKS